MGEIVAWDNLTASCGLKLSRSGCNFTEVPEPALDFKGVNNTDVVQKRTKSGSNHSHRDLSSTRFFYFPFPHLWYSYDSITTCWEISRQGSYSNRYISFFSPFFLQRTRQDSALMPVFGQTTRTTPNANRWSQYWTPPRHFRSTLSSCTSSAIPCHWLLAYSLSRFFFCSGESKEAPF